MPALALPERFTRLDMWLQVAFALLALLLIAFAALILRSAVAFTLALLKTETDTHMARREGMGLICFGVSVGAFGVAMATLPYWLPLVIGASIGSGWAHAGVVSLGAFAASLYALSEGLGTVLFARSRVGAVMLIWALITWIVWISADVFL